VRGGGGGARRPALHRRGRGAVAGRGARRQRVAADRKTNFAWDNRRYRVVSHASPTKEMHMSGTDQRLRHVLAGLAFPAQRWQVIVEAEYYGADARTRQELRALP